MIRDEYIELINQRVVGKKKAYRDRAILIDYLVDGYTYEKTAERNDLSVAQVVRIVDKWLYKIEKYIK